MAVDASPSTDLNQVMSEIREHYEGVIGKNRRELEAWYQNKVRGHNCLEYSHFSRLLRFYQVSMTVFFCYCDLLRSQQWNRM